MANSNSNDNNTFVLVNDVIVKKSKKGQILMTLSKHFKMA